MKATGYRQCILHRTDWIGYTSRVSYIPEPFGREGKVLKLKDGETWSDGWKVASAGSLRDADLVEHGERAYIYQRDRTDIRRGER